MCIRDRINYFEESNYWVLDAMRQQPEEDGRTLFLLGCNFFGMREEQKAQELSLIHI